LFLSLPPAIHSAVEAFPYSLGELQDQLVRRGSELISALRTTIGKTAEGEGIPTSPDEGRILLILDVPIKRTPCAEPERRDPTAFVLLESLTKLGEATGTLFSTGKGRHNRVIQLGPPKAEKSAWREIVILPITVEQSITRQAAQRFSGLYSAASDLKAVLAGVGALGSALAQIWTREGWGNWTFIDSDHIRPHNIARHIALDSHIGMPKVQAVYQMTSAVFSPGHLKIAGISANANGKDDADVSRALSEVQLLIDATTTLEVPRDLSANSTAPRSASAFLTPSGLHSALLMEDEGRTTRLDSLEAQYYRAVIQNGWGKEHLVGHHGELWVGAGCRDITSVIPYDLILIHAAMLSRQIREARLAPFAVIRVCELREQARTLVTNDIAVSSSRQSALGDWTVRFDAEIIRKMSVLRESHLPKETGGIVVGYYDQKLRNISVVDILGPPSDSQESETGFIRGQNGLKDILEEIARRTAYIVEYIGEWHSHPQYSSAWPSNFDVALLAYLEERLSSEGKPGLILILGDEEISVVLK
jgi:integrative and conjugative element protein (TIGR02256 family)